MVFYFVVVLIVGRVFKGISMVFQWYSSVLTYFNGIFEIALEIHLKTVKYP